MASTKTVTTSLVIDFNQAEGEGILTAEIDDRETGYNLGDTAFSPGSEPAFLLYMSSNVTVDAIKVSEGSLVLISGSVSIATTEYLTYANEKSAQPQHPVLTGSSAVTDSAGLTATPVVAETSVYFSTPQVGVLQLEYQSTARAYRLVGASGLRPVVVYIAGHTV